MTGLDFSRNIKIYICFILSSIFNFYVIASESTAEGLPSEWSYKNIYNEKQVVKYQKNDSGIFTLYSQSSRKSLSILSKTFKIQEGQAYRFSVEFKTEGVKFPANSIIALVRDKDNKPPKFYQVLSKVKKLKNNWHKLYVDEILAKRINKVEFSLAFLASSKGKVSFKNIHIKPITIVPKKTVKVSCISGNPPVPSTPERSLDYYQKLLEKAGKSGADIVCTPEFLNTVSLSGKKYKIEQLAEKLDQGPFSKMFSKIARQYSMYIVASIVEKDRGYLYDTAILYGRDGKLLGKYRKTHLAFGEIFNKGLTAGNQYPVFETDFGRIGILICYDLHFPEPARILSMKGVDMILVPNYGDARSKYKLWEHIAPVRAADNQCVIVSAVNNHNLYSVIVSRQGHILAREKNATGNVITADVDLNQSMKNYTGSAITDWYNVRRQPQTYEMITTDWFSTSSKK